ncbi:hypothetical protein FB561_6665 [Kribbella amoyensis]|uniref:Uncharacterized protein n=1 Tax=Kribbella amoyensis TaxID=996641 RepID=A0A561B8X8_9ACTN|nr:hypothetical protein [Kribbella amoyensis]TWD75227.1 hypothetical protein FB561_6665 [Kribbella amoyensis]
MVAVFADQYFLFPVVALALIGGIVLLLRWAFSRPKGGSLVRKTDYSPADPDTFGLLVVVDTVPTYNQARVRAAMLRDFGIKATTARTSDGWSVYVWPADEIAARGFLDAS